MDARIRSRVWIRCGRARHRRLRPTRRAFVVLLIASGCRWGGPREADPGARLLPGSSVHAVATAGGMLQFVLHIPAAPPRRLALRRPYPLILLLHGSNADGRTIE